MRSLWLVAVSSSLAVGLGACCPPVARRAAGDVAVAAVSDPDRYRLAHPATRATLARAGIDPDLLPCNDRVRWAPDLERYAERATEQVVKLLGHDTSDVDAGQRRRAARAILGYLVRAVFQETAAQNLGVMRLRGRHYRDAKGHGQPLLLFRSGVMLDTARPRACLAALIRLAKVRHVVNLYAGDFPLHDAIDAKRALAARLGASYHDERPVDRRWRELIAKPRDYQDNLQLAMQRVATLIREQILQPGGGPPQGNVYFHCGGGMHRSGMIFGILRRCINGASPSEIEHEYRRHAGFRGPGVPSGVEELNLRFIRDFDCSLLQQAAKLPGS